MTVRGHTGLAAAAIAVALAATGCGGGADEAKSSLDEALGYLPEDSGFVLVASTDERDYEELQKVLNRFPFGGRPKDLLEERLEGGGIDFDEDVKPLLGNEVVLGATDNGAFVDDSEGAPFVLALEVKDPGKLEDLVKSGSSERGGSEGYDIYQGSQDDTWVAIKDDVAVLSNAEGTLKDALERRGGDERMTEDTFEAAFDGLPEDAPVRAYVNVKELLAETPGARDALKIEWVDHVETLGLAAESTEERVSLHYALHTDPEGLTDEDLPLASGNATPQVLARDGGSSEIVFALRDPARLVAFAQAAAEAVDPAGFSRFEAGKRQAGKRLGIDVDRDILGQLTGDVAALATIDGRFGARAELEDPAAFKATLAKVMEGLPGFAEGVTVTPPSGGAGLYGVETESGESFALGVVNDVFVVATDAPLAGDVADRNLVHAPGQAGAFVAVADAEQVANAALAKYAGGLEALGGSLFTGPLGEVVSSAAASTDGISGRLELEIE